MARKLLLLYFAIVIGPLLLAALAFALKERLQRRSARRFPGDGHARQERLAETVEELRAP